MNTLSFPELLAKTTRSKAVSSLALAVNERKFPVDIEGSEGSLNALLLASVWNQGAFRQFFVIVPHEDAAGDLLLDLAQSGIHCAKFPWWGAAPYRELSPLASVFSERTLVLSDLALGKPGIYIIPERALLNAVPPRDYILSLLVTLRQGAKADVSALSRKLVTLGYTRVPRVQVHGEFALRGEVLDIFMGGADSGNEAYRVLFDFDTVEAIKNFDPVMQNTAGAKLDKLTIRPMKEVLWTDDIIETLEKNLADFKEFPDGGKSVIEELISRRSAKGEEMFFSLAFGGIKGAGNREQCACNILDYLDESGVLVLIDSERLLNAQDAFFREYQGQYARSKRDNCVYPLPERLLLNFEEILGGYVKSSSSRLISFRSIKGEPRPGHNHIELPCEPARSFFGNINYLKEEFASLIAAGWQIAVAAESEVQADRIRMILENNKSLSVMSSPLTAGFSLPDIKFMLIQENEIFGRRKRPPRSLKTVRSSPFDTFIEINPDDYVVHVNHGIGLFRGIERLTSFGNERDYIKIEYADEEIVFVPVEQLNLVQRYIGSEGSPPRLDTIGSKSWENRKNKVKKSVEDIAEKLIELYSKRKQAQGFAFPKDSEWQTMFEAAFPFEET